jgi:hypothetical protein
VGHGVGKGGLLTLSADPIRGEIAGGDAGCGTRGEGRQGPGPGSGKERLAGLLLMRVAPVLYGGVGASEERANPTQPNPPFPLRRGVASTQRVAPPPHVLQLTEEEKNTFGSVMRCDAMRCEAVEDLAKFIYVPRSCICMGGHTVGRVL